MNESIPELQEEFAEIIPTVQEGTIIAGVQSINGKAGDLDLKTINDTDLLTAGNLDLATSAQLSDLETVVEGKQDQLSDAQLAAVNSGIDSTLVAQITTNKNDITTINSKIPAQATSTNKLADKDFVNSSIATNTANYISNNGQPFTSVAQLEAYTGTVTNNDYAFVTGTDSAGNTYYDRYKATVVGSTVTWAKEYRLNNSSFTSDQWKSINSGITDTLVAQIGTNTSAIADLQTNKQDKLIAGTNIQISGTTISATDTTYSAGTGLTLSGTTFNVTEPVPAGFFTDTASTQEGEGTQFTLNNTTDAPIDEVELKGNTTQATLTGKNKLGYDYASIKSANSGSGRVFDDVAKTMTYNGVTYKINDDGTVLVTGTASGNSFLVLVNPVSGLVSATNYILNGCPSGGSASTYSLRIYTSGSYEWDGGSGLSFTYDSQDILRINMSSGTAAPADGLLFKPMIRLATETNPDYEIFCGGIPAPNPTYPEPVNVVTGSQTVNICGKNLWNMTPYQANHYIAADGTESTNNNIDTWGNVYAEPSTTMTIQIKSGHSGTGTLRIHAFSLNGEWIQQITTVTVSADTLASTTFTTPNQPCFVRWCYYNGPTPTNCQLERGDQATAYQPFKSQSYTIDLGIIELCKIGTYRDYIWKDGADWKVHKEIGKQTYDGSEAWNKVNLAFQTAAISGKGPYISTGFSNYFTFYPAQTGITSAIPNGQYGFNTSKVPTFRNDDCADAPAFKTWLSTHNTSIYYNLSTATDTVITDAGLIAQLEALAGSTTYAPQTNYATAGTGTNLPVILTIDVFKNNYAGLLARLEKAGA